MKIFCFILLCACPLAFAEFAVVHDELKDGSKMEVAHVDAGAVPVTLTDMFKAAWNDGAIRNTVEKGAFSNLVSPGAFLPNFNQPLVNSPFQFQSGSSQFSIAPMLCPHGITGVQIEDGGAGVYVNIPIPEKILQPVGDSLKELVGIIKDVRAETCAAGAKVEQGGKILLYVLGGALALALMVTALLFGIGRGHKATVVAHKATIEALKQVNNGNSNLA